MECVMDVEQICEVIPHRPPFLLIDRVVEFVPGEHLVAIKNVTMNEPYFMGHFPGRPVMPGALILEAIAQAAAVFAKCSDSVGIRGGYLMYLVGAKEFRWKRQVVPGDQLTIRVELVRRKRPMLVMRGEVTVDGEPVAWGTLSAAEGQ